MASIMVYGTTSSAGKSTICNALCRLYKRRGYKVYPFKSQNMSRNSYKMKNGALISSAQAIQAFCAGREPEYSMNPILLVPSSDIGSDVYINGKFFKHMKANEYYKIKKELRKAVQEIYTKVKDDNDVIIIEGAGSPAEINLLECDFVNTGMADIADTNCILVADIDRGGVFASIYGTYNILSEEDRKRIKAFIINKFRGDISILKPGIDKLQEMIGIPCIGVLPYTKLEIADEDSIKDYEKNANKHPENIRAMDAEIDRLCDLFETYIDIKRVDEIAGI